MRLPAVDRAFIEPRKLHDYLLSPSHPVGRFKAAFFQALGYSQAEWQILATDLMHHATECEAKKTEATPYGQKYEVSGSLRGPAGREAVIVAVWIVLDGEDHPRFVTAFPGPTP